MFKKRLIIYPPEKGAQGALLVIKKGGVILTPPNKLNKPYIGRQLERKRIFIIN